MPRPIGRYHVLRRTFVAFAKVAFSGHEYWAYDDDVKKTKIIIIDSWATNEDMPERKPRIVVSRGNMNDIDPTIGSYEKPSEIVGSQIEKKFFLMRSLQMVINCVASNDLVAEDIAAEVEKHLYAAKLDFLKRGIKIETVNVGAPQKMDSDSVHAKWYYVPVYVGILATRFFEMIDERDTYKDIGVTAVAKTNNDNE
jgi:hypothetical protein